MRALINEQPNPRVFFKVFLELDLNCLLPFISFDNESISQLLTEDNCEYFPKQYPLFFLDQKGKSAIDYALENNQMRSVTQMIHYIVRHQNRYEFNYLFRRNMRKLLMNDVACSSLLQSQIFNCHLDFDQWPVKATDPDKIIRPFNGNHLQLRSAHERVFGAPETRSCCGSNNKAESKTPAKNKKSQEHQVCYRLNMLPYVKGDIIEVLCDSNLEVFECEAVQDLIQYKWETFAQRSLAKGFVVHLLYIIVLLYYVDAMYLQTSHHPLPDCPMHLYQENLIDMRKMEKDN